VGRSPSYGEPSTKRDLLHTSQDNQRQQIATCLQQFNKDGRNTQEKNGDWRKSGYKKWWYLAENTCSDTVVPKRGIHYYLFVTDIACVHFGSTSFSRQFAQYLLTRK